MQELRLRSITNAQKKEKGKKHVLIQYSSDLRFPEQTFSCTWNSFFAGPSQSSAEITYIPPLPISVSHFSVLSAFGQKKIHSM
jgi:hypothetical protein